MAIRFPYENVDWSGEVVPSMSHGHGTTKAYFESAYAGGYRHIAPSNYQPADASRAFPLTNMIGLDAEDIPADAIGGPNAEHRDFVGVAGHVSGMGSMHISGVDGASSGPWRDALDSIAAAMIYPNAGAISINHPRLEAPPVSVAMDMMDHCAHVNGIEAFSSLGEWNYGGRGWATAYWHLILRTGRQCYGFAAPDHIVGDPGETFPGWRGFNRLLLPSGLWSLSKADQEKACLEAYYEGRWYGAVAPTSPELTGMTADATEVTVTFGESCAITWYWARPGDAAAQMVSGGTGTTSTYTLRGDEVYVRAVGTLSQYEVSFTQPVMYLGVEDIPQGDDAKRRLLLLS